MNNPNPEVWEVRPKSPGELAEQFLAIPNPSFGPGNAEMTQRYESAATKFAKTLILDRSPEEAEKLLDTLPEDHADIRHYDNRLYGYIAAVRTLHQKREASFRNAIREMSSTSLTDEKIHEQEAMLRVNTIDLTSDTPNQHAIKTLFPSGNWLLHSTTATNIAGIMRNGKIDTTAGLVAKNRNGGMDRSVGGAMGISWNYNNVTALLGDHRHLAGFMTDPEVLLSSQGGMLAISQKSCWDELQYYNAPAEEIDEIRDIEGLYNGVMPVAMAFEAIGRVTNPMRNLEPKPEDAAAEVMSKDEEQALVELNQRLSEGVDPNYLRRFYRVDSKNNFWFAPHVGEQDVKHMHTLAFLQACADGHFGEEVAGRLQHRLPNKLSAGTLMIIAPAMQKLAQNLEKIMVEKGEKIGEASAVDIENTVFYCPAGDYETWVKVLAKARRIPRGIVVYDGKKVRNTSAFAQSLPDDSKEELTSQLELLNTSTEHEWEDFFEDEPLESRHARFLIDYTQTANAGVMVYDGELKTLSLDDLDD